MCLTIGDCWTDSLDAAKDQVSSVLDSPDALSPWGGQSDSEEWWKGMSLIQPPLLLLLGVASQLAIEAILSAACCTVVSFWASTAAAAAAVSTGTMTCSKRECFTCAQLHK